jgi:hypothetical protein
VVTVSWPDAAAICRGLADFAARGAATGIWTMARQAIFH